MTSRGDNIRRIRDIVGWYRDKYGGISGMYIPPLTTDLIALFDEVAGTVQDMDERQRAAERLPLGHCRREYRREVAP